MITNEQRTNLEARIAELEESCRVKDQKFNQLCKDYDSHDAELKRIISNQRATLEEIAKTSSNTKILRIANEALK